MSVFDFLKPGESNQFDKLLLEELKRLLCDFVDKNGDSMLQQLKKEWQDRGFISLLENITPIIEESRKIYIKKLEEQLNLQSKSKILKYLKSEDDLEIVNMCVLFNTEIKDFQTSLSTRTYRCLTENGIYTIGDICRLKKEELTKIAGLGSKSRTEIEDLLENFNLYLGMDVDKYFISLYKKTNTD